MKKVLMILVCLMAMTVSVNGQNHVVDAFKSNCKIEESDTIELSPNLYLTPNTSIKDNYAKIDSILTFYKTKNIKNYTVNIMGHYTNEKNEFHDCYIQSIKYKNCDGDIIKALTKIYARSLDVPFEYDADCIKVNQKSYGEFITEPTRRLFKNQNGTVTREYRERFIGGGYGGNNFYVLKENTRLYKMIYRRVRQTVEPSQVTSLENKRIDKTHSSANYLRTISSDMHFSKFFISVILGKIQ